MQQQAPGPVASLTGDKQQVSAEEPHAQDHQNTVQDHAIYSSSPQTAHQTEEVTPKAPQTSGGPWSLMLGRLRPVWDAGTSSTTEQEIP